MFESFLCLDDSIDDVSHSVGSLNVGSDDAGNDGVGVSEGDLLAGHSDNEGFAADRFHGSGGQILALQPGSDDVPEKNLGQGFLVGQEVVQRFLVDLGKGGVAGRENSEWSSCGIKGICILRKNYCLN